jgi:serpin B
MVIILPEEQDLSRVEDSLDATTLSRWEDSCTNRRVHVYFPKFRLETMYSLPPTLAGMGMPSAFTPAADFSGIDGTKDLYISDVIHKAFIEVTEEGTEAAAATGVVMPLKAVPSEEIVPVFRADHPFIFLIQDDKTENILFMGRVIDP